MLITKSVDGVPIRLTEERWQHIVDRHPEMKGQKAELTDKYLVAVYREISPSDGFIVTAYFATEPAKWREVLRRR